MKLNHLAKDYLELAKQIDQLEKMEINWDSVLNNIIGFLKNGAEDMLNSTVSVTSGITYALMVGVLAGRQSVRRLAHAFLHPAYFILLRAAERGRES